MPLIFLNPCKDLPIHTSAWTRARTGDPFLFREVLYQLSYPSVRGLLARLREVYQLFNFSESRQAEESGSRAGRQSGGRGNFRNDGCQIFRVHVERHGEHENPDDDGA